MNEGKCDWDGDGREHDEALFRVHFWRWACQDLDWSDACAMCFLERIDERATAWKGVHTRRGDEDMKIEKDPDGKGDVWFIPESRYVTARNAAFYAKRRLES